QNDVTLKMPAFEWVHVQLHQQKGMISLSPPTICNSADCLYVLKGHCCKVSDEAAFCLIQRPYISKTLLTRRISPRGSP
ncbi:hypothetical protein OF895_26175, partial [Escherichia coli]|uniref:hypothetical protein n=1 Tax=Escherichia coli TaxID=562 RepID=UPI0021E3D3F7